MHPSPRRRCSAECRYAMPRAELSGAVALDSVGETGHGAKAKGEIADTVVEWDGLSVLLQDGSSIFNSTLAFSSHVSEGTKKTLSRQDGIVVSRDHAETRLRSRRGAIFNAANYICHRLPLRHPRGNACADRRSPETFFDQFSFHHNSTSQYYQDTQRQKYNVETPHREHP